MDLFGFNDQGLELIVIPHEINMDWVPPFDEAMDWLVDNAAADLMADVFTEEPKTVGFKYAGCKEGGAWSRPGGDVGTAADGFAATFEACAELCGSRGFKYFGLECPMVGATHCQCQDGTNLGRIVADEDCHGAMNGAHCWNTSELWHLD